MEKHQNRIQISFANAFKDDGEGVITFPKGLTITDSSEQWNGTKYDINSMDLSGYKGMLTADHSQSVEKILGKTFGIKKVGGKRVTIDGIQFATKESALAVYAYNMIKGGYLTDFSIETVGPWPDDDGVYHEASLVGLSAVITGNNKSANLNAVVKNSIEEAKKEGLDTSLVEKDFLCYDLPEEENNNSYQEETEMKFVTIKNGRSFEVSVSYKNAAGEQVTKVISSGETLDVSEDQKQSIEQQFTNAQEPKKEIDVVDTVTKAVNAAMAPVMEKVQKLEQKSFDNAAKEPEFQKGDAKNGADSLKKMNWKQRGGQQILHAWNFFKGHDFEALKELKKINELHFEQLQEKGLVENAITIADMGDYVISPEQLTEIQGFRSDFSGLLNMTTWRDTLSTRMAWLNRSGDINMQPVEFCDDGSDGNLKPISEYSATLRTADLEELAAVTPVCNAATRFLAADLLSDLAGGYRTDYDRKRAQLVIARLQQAVNATGQTQSYSKTSDTASLKSFITVWSQLSEEIPNGTFIFNYRTYGELLRSLVGAGISTDTAMGLFTTGNQPMILGRPYVVVPNELLPDLNSAGTKTFVVDGSNVTINKAVFYADLTKFTGRTSGGLRYEFSTEAAYEEGETVKSAFQRDELLARGYFYRGGAFLDNTRVTALGAAAVS